MKDCHQAWRALTLHIPVSGKADSWVAGRNWTLISKDLMNLLPTASDVKGEILSDTLDERGSPIELRGHFRYLDLASAVCEFRDIWKQAKFPDRTELIHAERFADGSFKHHILIRYIDGRMDPFSTKLTEEVLLGPHNA